MGEVLQNWLVRRLGILKSLEPNKIGDKFKDGMLFFKILESYNIVNSEYLSHLVTARTPEAAMKNLRQLCVWLRLFNVEYSEAILKEISEGNTSTCIRILYELYICLENKEHWHFVTKKKVDQLMKTPITDYDVKKIEEKPTKEVEPTRNRLTEPFYTKQKVINAYREKEKELTEKCKQNSVQRLNRLIAKEKTVPTREFAIDPTKKSDETAEAFETAKEIAEFSKNLASRKTEDLIERSPSQYVGWLKSKHERKETNHRIKATLHNVLHVEMWNEMLKKEDEKFQSSISKKLLRQSEFEKQLAIRMLQIQHQHKVFVENKKKVRIRSDAQEENMTAFDYLNVQLDEKESESKMEAKRIEELLKRLLDEETSARKREKFEMCSQAVSDIVDVATKTSNYEKKNKAPVPDKIKEEWKTLFRKSLPTTPNLTLEQVLFELNRKETGEESSPSEPRTEEETEYINALNQDFECIETLNDRDLEQYLNLTGFWMPEYWPELKFSDKAENILGFVVHRLLEFKYPLPSKEKPANLPSFRIRASVSPLSDMAAVNLLKSTLNKWGIAVIETQTIVDFCIGQSLRNCPLHVSPTESNESYKRERHPLVKDKERLRKSLKVDLDRLDKTTQVPSEVDETEEEEEEITLSNLVKEAVDLLTQGMALPDSLLVKLLVEYLKFIPDVLGWVLLNYPLLCSQVELLESTFTGTKVPISCPEDAAGVRPNSDVTESELLQKRTSRVLPRPNPAPVSAEFTPYLTHYIKLRPDEKHRQEHGIKATADPPSITSTMSSESDSPSQFYEARGLFYLLNYTALDSGTFRKLAQILVGDSARKKPPQEEPEESKSINFSDPSPTKPKYKRLSRNSSMARIFKNKKDSVRCSSEEEKPGGPDWVFTESPLDPYFHVPMASYWESIERTYLYNIRWLSFLIRTHDSMVVPYCNYASTRIRDVSDCPDDRQNLVSEFQSYLNGIPEDLRSKKEVKSELYCRVSELQIKLWDLCEAKKRSAEAVRTNLIYHNWTTEHMGTIRHIFFNLLQTESDRFVDSLQLLQDYYSLALNRQPVDGKVDRISVYRGKNSRYNSLSTLSNMGGKKKNPEPKKGKKAGATGSEPFNSSFHSLVDHLLDPDVETNRPYRFQEKVIAAADCVTAESKLVAATCEETARREFEVSLVDKDLGSRVKKKDSTVPAMTANQFRQQDKMWREWGAGIYEALDRFIFRIELVKHRALEDLSEIQDKMLNLFHSFHHEIACRHYAGLKNTESLCKLLKVAIEEESPIRPKIIFDLERFYLDSDSSVLDIPPPPPPPTPIREMGDDYRFTVGQLQNLLLKMKVVAPLGVIEEPFVDILRDMAYFGRERGFPYLPAGWSRLSRDDIRTVLVRAFGESAVIDWKDFLLFGADIPFPSVQELLSLREAMLGKDEKKTELIGREDYDSLVLWFEKSETRSETEVLRIGLMKDFLFRLFQVSPNEMNYTAMLLAFCKADDPVDGFGKALALLAGTGFILREDKGETKTKKDLDKRLHGRDIAEEVVEQILRQVRQATEGSIIEDVRAKSKERVARKAERERPEAPLHRSEVKLSEIDPTEPYPWESTSNSDSTHTPCTELSHSSTESSHSDSGGETYASFAPYNLVLSVLLAAIRFPHDNLSEQRRLEEGLAELFRTKGTGDLIKTNVLVRSDFMENLFSRVYKFKTANLSELVVSIVEPELIVRL